MTMIARTADTRERMVLDARSCSSLEALGR